MQPNPDLQIVNPNPHFHFQRKLSEEEKEEKEIEYWTGIDSKGPVNVTEQKNMLRYRVGIVTKLESHKN